MEKAEPVERLLGRDVLADDRRFFKLTDRSLPSTGCEIHAITAAAEWVLVQGQRRGESRG
jgi:hypothetical protein